MSNFPVADGQIEGVHDDGTASGVVKTKLVNGGLVAVPIFRYGYTTNTLGIATVIFNSNLFGNGDGTATGVQFNTQSTGVPSASNQNMGSMTFNVKGKSFGIRFDAGLTLQPFTVVIDGIAYPVKQQDTGIFKNNQIQSLLANPGTYYDNNRSVILFTDLPDINHTVVVIVSMGLTNKKVTIYGTLQEERLGIKPVARIDAMYGWGVLTTTQTQLPIIFTDTLTMNNFPVAVKSIIYSNTDTVARIVTVTNFTGGAIIWQASIPAASTVKFDISNNGVQPAYLKHAADLAAKVNFTCITGL